MMSASDNFAGALARTVLLVKLDFFPELPEAQIAAGLAGVHVRLVADAANLETPAAQTAIVAAAIAVSQSGAGVILDIGDVDLVAPQPPLKASDGGIATALRTHLGHLPSPPSRDLGSRPADLTVLLGDTPEAGDVVGELAFRVTGDSWSTEITAGTEPVSRWSGDQPFGGVLAGCAIAAESFRRAICGLSALHLLDPLPGHHLAAAERVALGVEPILSLAPIRSSVDVVSGGAITNGAIFALQRVPGFPVAMRIFDDDSVELSNLNRYPLLSLDDLGVLKVDALLSALPSAWTASSVRSRLDSRWVDIGGALSRDVLVGVDDIPSRWLVQSCAPDWVCVAGTSHFEVVISEHVLGGPCAGCMHPRDDPGHEPIPTVSFVSMLAGVLQAHRLVRRAAGEPPLPASIAWGLGLDGPHGLMHLGQSARVDCPVGCAASAALTSTGSDGRLPESK